MTAYTKPHLSFDDQVQLLKSRGMVIDDPAAASDLLSVVGYYRLSGYWYPYRRRLGPAQRDDRFVEGTTFAAVVRLYDTDRRLKLHVLDAIERVEIALRVMISFTLGKRGAYAHLNRSNLDGQFTQARGREPSRYDEWVAKLVGAQARSTEDFVVHFQQKYDGRLPVWVVTEILDFGSTAHLYRGLKAADRNAIARDLDVVDQTGLGNGHALGNWLRVLNYVRNICAHHSRLWNRHLVYKIASRQLAHVSDLRHLTAPDVPPHRIYSMLCVLAFLVERVGQGTDWASRLRQLLSMEIPACGRSLAELGFPEGWAAHRPWANGGAAHGRDGVV
ncbi:abortive infection bacteriophage resistance protein [Kribbella antiqua]|uniref:Abortive infection bacteriophage resistance protein n=2 Tax=Kribbella antiqua TaxID=2512217 RepID=A0A4R2IMV0_9ACTN|nr:abortive infection bacteriophage resistance protein [Kribbella antiqua]